MLIMLCGCCILSNEAEIKNYLEGTNIQKYGTYDLHLIDQNDVNYAKLILPIDESKLALEDKTPDLYNTSNSQSLQSYQNYTPKRATNDSTNNKPTNKLVTTITSQINESKANPNRILTDDDLMLTSDNEKNFGNELPWDREIGFCEVLKGTDRDLYSNVVNDAIITFF